MARFFTNFSEYQTGASPYDWEQRWVVGGHKATVEEDPAAAGGKILRHVVSEHDRRALAWMRIRGASTVDLVTRVRAHGTDARFGIVGRGAGFGPHRYNEDGFTLEIEDESEQRIATRSYDRRSIKTAGRDKPASAHRTGITPFPWEPGTWYWLRLNLRHHPEDGVAVRAKAWTEASGEPDSWDHEEEGAQPYYVGAGGWFGITGQRTGIRDYDLFGVGTDGDAAPTS